MLDRHPPEAMRYRETDSEPLNSSSTAISAIILKASMQTCNTALSVYIDYSHKTSIIAMIKDCLNRVPATFGG